MWEVISFEKYFKRKELSGLWLGIEESDDKNEQWIESSEYTNFEMQAVLSELSKFSDEINEILNSYDIEHIDADTLKSYIEMFFMYTFKKNNLISTEAFSTARYISYISFLILKWELLPKSRIDELLQTWDFLWLANNSIARHLIWEYRSRKSPFNEKDLVKQAEFYYWLHFQRTKIDIYKTLSSNLLYYNEAIWWVDNVMSKALPSFRLL